MPVRPGQTRASAGRSSGKVAMMRLGMRVLCVVLVLFLAVGWALATFPSAALARITTVEAPAGVQPQAVQFGRPWDRYPTVLIVSSTGDARIPLVHEAVAFWNQQLDQVGSSFRLGPVDHTTTELIPDDYLIARGRAVDRGDRPPPVPEQVWTLPGDLVVALSDQVFVSFSTPPGPGQKVLVGF